jgi:DNA modification methylase
MPTAIEMRLVAELLPYSRNSRNHSDAQIEALCASMRGPAGFTNPILIADGGILAGHGRLKAAKKLGLTRVPCIDLSHLSDHERKALIIWDNRSAELGSTWDLGMLKLETDDLRAAGLDVEAVTGFDEGDLAELFAGLTEPDAPAGAGDPDDVPPVPADPVSVPGDVWQCGPHRVMCGSSLIDADWDRLMDGKQADAVWTDPPYNVDIGVKNKRLDDADKGNRGKTGGIANDSMGDKEFRAFLLGMYSAVIQQMKPGAPIYVAHADAEGINFRASFRDAGFKLQSCLIWNKNVMVLGRWDYQAKHEPILYGWKPGAAHKWYGGRKNTSVINMGDGSPFTAMPDGRYQIKIGDNVLIVSADAMVEEFPSSVIYEPKPSKSGLHPTQKPVALVERMLKQSARAGDIVLDAFGGSGTTMIAADRLGMRARLMELDPKFCDVIVTRWQMLTGQRATHAATGEFFPEEGEPRRPAPTPEPAFETVDDNPF